MQIKSSTTLRNNYSAISKLAKETQEPIYITVNGEGDGVFMNIDAFEKREAIYRLREVIMEREAQRVEASKTYSIEEARTMLKDRLNQKYYYQCNQHDSPIENYAGIDDLKE